MNDFLVSLARRGAGLAPFVRAAPLLPPPSVPEASAESAGEGVPPPTSRMRDPILSPAPAAPHPFAAPTVAATPALPIAPVPAPAVQREPVERTTAPAASQPPVVIAPFEPPHRMPSHEPSPIDSRIAPLSRRAESPEIARPAPAVAPSPTEPVALVLASASATIEPTTADQGEVRVPADRPGEAVTLRTTEVRTIWSEIPAPQAGRGDAEVAGTRADATPQRISAAPAAVLLTPRVVEMPAPEPRGDPADRVASKRQKSDPEPTDRIRARPEPLRTVEVVREETQIVERDVEPASETVREIETVELVPLPTPRVAPAPQSAEPTPERVVQVRIGSIEIHTSEPARPAVPPPTPPVQEARQPLGFDSFARLRRYEPWQW